MMYIITLQATFPSPFITEMKRVLRDNKCSWRQMHCSGLDMWQSMAFTRFANNMDSYYVGSGVDEKDYFTIQGDELTLRSTVPHNKMLIVDLKSMLESVALCSQIEVEETNNV